MLKKVNKEIDKLETLKNRKTEMRSQLDKEIDEISAKLNRLYNLQTELGKIENTVNDYFDSSDKATK